MPHAPARPNMMTTHYGPLGQCGRGLRDYSATRQPLATAFLRVRASRSCGEQTSNIVRPTVIVAAMERLVLPPSGTIALVAINPERNVRRRWSIELVEDMFGWWTLTTRWGRIGTRGRGRTVAHADLRAANREAEACLGRRSSAPNRLGVPFAITRGDVQE
jgi:predicted DNA-binding WGR domain protein